MTKNTPIILDRLSQALAEHNIKLKRTALLQILIKALGYNNAHQFTAEDKSGKIDMPKAIYHGRDSVEGIGDMYVFQEEDGTYFLIDADKLDEQKTRANQWVTSPFGKVYDISDFRETEIYKNYEAKLAKLAKQAEHNAKKAEEYKSSETIVLCTNCSWVGNDDECKPIKDLGQRVNAGEQMPAGECPECGALAYNISSL